MIEYNPKRRLHYIPGGAIMTDGGMWPSSGNWWIPATGSFTCVAAYQAKGAASLAASYVNLANPGTYDAAPGDAPTFDAATGWTFNGTSDYLTTGITPASGWSMLVRYSNWSLTAVFNALIGMHTDTGSGTERDRRFFIARRNTPDYLFGAGGLLSIAGTVPSSGVLGIAGQKGYKDGTVEAGTIPDWKEPNNAIAIVIGAANIATVGGVSNYSSVKIQAIAIYSTTLDATQVDEVTDAMNAL